MFDCKHFFYFLFKANKKMTGTIDLTISALKPRLLIIEVFAGLRKLVFLIFIKKRNRDSAKFAKFAHWLLNTKKIEERCVKEIKNYKFTRKY